MSFDDSQSHQTATLTVEQIEEILATCYPGMRETVLTPEEARIRAEMIAEDMATVRFPLRLDTCWHVPSEGHEPIVIPSYLLEGSMYGPDSDPHGEQNRDAAGPLLSCGEFIRLSRACKLGRDLLGPQQWPSRLAAGLRDTQQHLSTIEEMLWLGRWHSPRNVQINYQQNQASAKDIDWRFDCCGYTINLEVKYRLRDWIGIVDGPHFFA